MRASRLAGLPFGIDPLDLFTTLNVRLGLKKLTCRASLSIVGIQESILNILSNMGQDLQNIVISSNSMQYGGEPDNWSLMGGLDPANFISNNRRQGWT